MVLIVSYQFEPESDDETVEVADQQEQDVFSVVRVKFVVL